MHLIAGVARFTGESVWDTTQPSGQPRCELDIVRAPAYPGAEVVGTYGTERRIAHNDIRHHTIA